MVDKMTIYRVTDPEFAPYGRVLSLPAEELIAAAETLEMPQSGSRYEPSLEVLERVKIAETIEDEFYGEMPIQVGLCWGHNNRLNALEWHTSSEINVAATDFVLMLGRIDEIKDGMYDSSRVKSFRVRRGESIEVYATTLHFCPCTTDADGFRCVVVLPRGTNVPLDGTPTDPLLFRKNKWVICHVDNEALKARGVRPGITGVNHVLNDYSSVEEFCRSSDRAERSEV